MKLNDLYQILISEGKKLSLADSIPKQFKGKRVVLVPIEQILRTEGASKEEYEGTDQLNTWFSQYGKKPQTGITGKTFPPVELWSLEDFLVPSKRTRWVKNHLRRFPGSLKKLQQAYQQGYRFQLMDGHHRLSFFEYKGFTEIPAIIEKTPE